MQLIIAQQGTVTMSDLENVAEAYDMLHAQSEQPASPQQNASGGVQTRAQRAAAARADQHHGHETASMSGQGRGGARAWRGSGRRGGFQESHPAGPGAFSACPAGIHTISLYGNAGNNAHVQLSKSADAPAASAAAQRTLHTRPYNAEPHVHAPVEASPPAHTPPVAGPSQFDCYRVRLGLPKSLVECLGSSNVQMSLGAMLDMAVDPEFQDAWKPMREYISKIPAHVHTVNANIPVKGEEPVAKVGAAHEVAREAKTDAVKANVQNKPLLMPQSSPLTLSPRCRLHQWVR